MDEWSAASGNTLLRDHREAFHCAMEEIFYGPLGELTVSAEQRNCPTREVLPAHPERIAARKAQGAELRVIFSAGGCIPASPLEGECN